MIDSREKEIVSENLINFSYLNEFADGDPVFIQKMVSLFLTNAPVALKLILECNAMDNIQVLKTEVHKLKSSISLLGISKASKSIEIIESEIETNPLGQRRKEEVGIFNDICERSIDELERTHGFSKML